jgi:hypothetical protein
MSNEGMRHAPDGKALKLPRSVAPTKAALLCRQADLAQQRLKTRIRPQRRECRIDGEHQERACPLLEALPELCECTLGIAQRELEWYSGNVGTGLVAQTKTITQQVFRLPGTVCQ